VARTSDAKVSVRKSVATSDGVAPAQKFGFDEADGMRWTRGSGEGWFGRPAKAVPSDEGRWNDDEGQRDAALSVVVRERRGHAKVKRDSNARRGSP
jgi:hypothetical protein